ncbi:hypothetical protein BH20CHL6_BH20CHL6_09650 [soil metagenome]
MRRGDLGTARRRVPTLGIPTAVDVASLALIAGAVVALWRVVDAPPALILGLLLATSLIYSRWRSAVTTAVHRLVSTEVRERATIAAMDAERGRLARELHDAPLQELAGVIKRLEVIPGASREADTLLQVAGHLRQIASELHPPVLQDLGFAPALTSLLGNHQTPAQARQLLLSLDDRTSFAEFERLPPDVELAVYRIVQEAVTNAQRHSGGSIVKVDGVVSPDRISISVSDDGIGLNEDKVRRAQRKGHLGLSSMRQRAATIGAALDFGAAEGGGTVVQLRWERR